MKNKLLLLVIGLTMTTITYGQHTKDNPVSVVSENRDTLFLVNGSVGCMIQEVWVENYEEEKPVILMKSIDWIIRENNRRKKEEDGTESDN